MARTSNSQNDLTDLQKRVLMQFRQIYGAVKSHFREVESECGISGSQIWLLREIAENPGIGVSELAKCLSIHQSTCSTLVDKLVIAKLVSKDRSAADQRRVGVQITAGGRSLLRRAPGPSEGVLPDALRQLPDIALQMLDINLTEVIHHLATHSSGDAKKPLADL